MARRHDNAFFRQRNGRGQQARKRQRRRFGLQHGLPGRKRARDRIGGQRPAPGHHIMTRPGIEPQIGLGRRRADPVDAMKAPVALADQPEAVAANAGHVRIDDRQRGRDGDRRLRGAAPSSSTPRPACAAR
jgi:hypothetical protein